MVTIQINGQSVRCKTSWNELTVADFQRVYREWKSNFELPVLDRNYFHLFCLINDLIFSSYEATPENEEIITTYIMWAVADHGFSKEVPKTYQIDGRVMVVPEKFQSLSVGQNILMRQLIQKATYKEELLADAIAIVAQPQFDGKFNSKRVAELKELVLETPVHEVYGLGFFWLTHAMQAGRGQVNYYSLLRGNLMRILKRMLQPWQSPTALSGSLISDSLPDTQKDLVKTLMKYSIGSVLELSYALQQKLRSQASIKNGFHISGIQ